MREVLVNQGLRLLGGGEGGLNVGVYARACISICLLIAFMSV